MSNDAMDPAERRRLKFEEKLKRHAEEIISLSEQSNHPKDSTTQYATFCANMDGVVCKFVVPESIKVVGIGSSAYVSSFSHHVEQFLEGMMKDEVIFEKVHDTVHDEIQLHANLIAQDNFPPYEEDFDGEGYQDAVDKEINNHIPYFSGRVARFVESHVSMTATFVDNAIERYYESSLVDIMGVLDIVSETISDIITKKTIDIIQEALVETVCALYIKDFSTNYIRESIMNDIQSDSRLVAIRIVDSVCLIIDDTLTTLIVRAFRLMCVLPGSGKSNDNDIVMENVAQKVSEMQL